MSLVFLKCKLHNWVSSRQFLNVYRCIKLASYPDMAKWMASNAFIVTERGLCELKWRIGRERTSDGVPPRLEPSVQLMPLSATMRTVSRSLLDSERSFNIFIQTSIKSILSLKAYWLNRKNWSASFGEILFSNPFRKTFISLLTSSI